MGGVCSEIDAERAVLRSWCSWNKGGGEAAVELGRGAGGAWTGSGGDWFAGSQIVWATSPSETLVFELQRASMALVPCMRAPGAAFCARIDYQGTPCLALFSQAHRFSRKADLQDFVLVTFSPAPAVVLRCGTGVAVHTGPAGTDPVPEHEAADRLVKVAVALEERVRVARAHNDRAWALVAEKVELVGAARRWLWPGPDANRAELPVAWRELQVVAPGSEPVPLTSTKREKSGRQPPAHGRPRVLSAGQAVVDGMWVLRLTMPRDGAPAAMAGVVQGLAGEVETVVGLEESENESEGLVTAVRVMVPLPHLLGSKAIRVGLVLGGQTLFGTVTPDLWRPEYLDRPRMLRTSLPFPLTLAINLVPARSEHNLVSHLESHLGLPNSASLPLTCTLRTTNSTVVLQGRTWSAAHAEWILSAVRSLLPEGATMVSATGGTPRGLLEATRAAAQALLQGKAPDRPMAKVLK